MRILTIVGARPQFVKAAVVSRAILLRGGIEERIVHTGQHFDANMSEIFFEEMSIPLPKYNLNINSVSHGKMTGRMLEKLEDLMIADAPDLVLVYGDTNSTLAGALAAAKLHIPVAHVEAGLRSFNMKMPEEVNRVLTDRVSRWLFCPTVQAEKNLRDEGYDNLGAIIYNSGDVMLDAARYYEKSLDDRPSNLRLPDEKYILATLHREENVSDPVRLKALIDALNAVHESVAPVVMPIHPGSARRIASGNLSVKFKMIDPVGYFDMIRLIKRSRMVVTDSGGLQKEAFFFGKYCVTMRDETEWIELVENNVNYLVGANTERLIDAVRSVGARTFPQGLGLYGDGRAGEKIVDRICEA